MKLENLKIGNDIIETIKFNNAQIKKLNDTKAYSPSEFKISVLSNSYKIPYSILNTVLLLIENEYKEENKKLEKDFENL